MPAAAAHNIALVDRRTAPSSAPRTMDQAKSKPQVIPSIHVIGEAKLRLSTNASNTSRSGQTTRPAKTINATAAKVRRRFCMVGARRASLERPSATNVRCTGEGCQRNAKDTLSSVLAHPASLQRDAMAGGAAG